MTPTTMHHNNICSTCRGYGFVYITDFYGHPDFGRAVPCPNCALSSPEFRKRIERYAGILPAYAKATLTSFPHDIITAIEKALNTAIERSIVVTVHGATGAGKTYLLTAVVNAAIQRGYTAKFVEAFTVFEHFEKTRYSDDFDDFYNYMRDASVLVVDELDKFPPSAYAFARFFSLFNYRITRSYGLTAFALNRDPRRGIWSDAVGPIESRILAKHNIVINLGTKDKRL